MKILPKQFPRIYRIITENKFLKNLKARGFYKFSTIILSTIAIILLTIFIVLISINFSQNFLQFRQIYLQRQDLNGRINFWNSITSKYPGYPDAYFNIAVLYYNLSDFNNSRIYLQKTLIYNPNFKESKMLDDLLTQRGY